MTQDDILEMARSAGVTDGIELQHEIDAVMRFAVLVAAAERDACAKACDELVSPSRSHSDPGRAWITGTLDCAAAIRARGDA